MAVGDANVFPGFLTQVLTQLFLPKPLTTFLTCFCRGERRKYARKKSTLTGDQTHNYESWFRHANHWATRVGLRNKLRFFIPCQSLSKWSHMIGDLHHSCLGKKLKPFGNFSFRVFSYLVVFGCIWGLMPLCQLRSYHGLIVPLSLLNATKTTRLVHWPPLSLDYLK